MNELFRKFAQKTSQLVGTSWAFILAVLIIVVWGVTGPMFHYSDTWQLVINTGTTIITFMMVFLIQNTQNRDAKAIHLKLDELIKGVKGARTGFVNLEDLSDEELDRLRQEFAKLQRKANHKDRPSAQLSKYENVVEAAENAKEAEESPT
jgi:low affinity Fe/Cu permease